MMPPILQCQVLPSPACHCAASMSFLLYARCFPRIVYSMCYLQFILIRVFFFLVSYNFRRVRLLVTHYQNVWISSETVKLRASLLNRKCPGMALFTNAFLAGTQLPLNVTYLSTCFAISDCILNGSLQKKSWANLRLATRQIWLGCSNK
jgi:hypothetical protein